MLESIRTTFVRPFTKPEEASRTYLSKSEIILFQDGNHINAPLFMGDDVSLEDLQEKIVSRLLAIPEFTRSIKKDASGKLYWNENGPVAQENQVAERELETHSKPVLQELFKELRDRPLDTSKVLWDVMLCHTPDKKSILFFRIHHGLSDGYGLISLLREICDKSDVQELSLPAEANLTEAKPLDERVSTVAKHLLAAGIKAASLPLKSCRKIIHTLHGAALTTHNVAQELFKFISQKPDSLTAIKRQEYMTHHALDWIDEPLDLAAVKAIAKTIPDRHITVNDVILTIYSEAARKYITLKTSGEPDFSKINFHCMMPFMAGDFRQAKMEGKKLQLGNHVSLVTVKTPLEIADCKKRLVAIHDNMISLKKSAASNVSFAFGRALAYLPNKMVQKVSALILNQASLFASNVRGPAEQVSLGGHKVENILNFGRAFGNLAVGNLILSYNGKVNMVLTVDGDLIDTDLFQKLLRRSFEELKVAV